MHCNYITSHLHWNSCAGDLSLRCPQHSISAGALSREQSTVPIDQHPRYSQWTLTRVVTLVLPAAFSAVHLYTPASLRLTAPSLSVPSGAILRPPPATTGKPSCSQRWVGRGRAESTEHGRERGEPSTVFTSAGVSVSTGGTGTRQEGGEGGAKCHGPVMYSFPSIIKFGQILLTL